MSVESVLKQLEELEVKFVDLRFTDTKGKEQHVSIPAHQVDADFFEDGKMFDGSSIAGWKGINESDMVLMPDPTTFVLDPFTEETTALIRCDILEPGTMTDMSGCFVKIDAKEAAWNSGTSYEGGNTGHRPFVKGGYFPVAPVDSSQDLRSAMCLVLEEMGQVVEAHHHEVATAGQNEIATRFNTLTKKADEIQILKYVVHNMAHAYGKTATFMPKPIVGDNGSGMHVHQSLAKDGVNLFAGDKYAGLSETALYYIGGIIKHARALNAFTNPSTNSYKRLVPHFEAPVMLAYSARNRSASIRIPVVPSPKGRRIETRFPDPHANPYLGFAALLMAGIDGIQNKIHPGEAMDKDLYDLPAEEAAEIPQVATSLENALENLQADHEFLTRGGVFSEDFIQSYIALKSAEAERVSRTTHPLEFEMYYSL